MSTAREQEPPHRMSTAPFLSPGAVAPLSRQLVERTAGPDPSVHAWRAGGPILPGEPPPGELARRLSETDLACLAESELEAFVAACRHLEGWVLIRAEAARSQLEGRRGG